MREVKFRGQDCFGNWQFGSLVTDNQTFWFIRNSVCDVSVDPKTVGQYTGLKDKNGVEIYEGDALNDASGKYMIVGWSLRFASYVLNREGWAFSHWFGESCDAGACEVIGNSHDNPEFLK